MTPPARDAGERASEKAKQSRSKTTDTTKEGTEKRKKRINHVFLANKTYLQLVLLRSVCLKRAL